MKIFKHQLLGLILFFTAIHMAMAQRIVVLTPDIADIVVALGAQGSVVGRDQTNQNPALKSVPSIGIHRQLSVEPIVAIKPDIAIGSWMAQPQTIYANLNKIGIKAVNVSPKDEINDYPDSLITVGKILGREKQAEQLAAKWKQGVKQLPMTGKRYLLSYDGRLVAGKNTAADELIRRAGGVNAAGHIDGIKPMSREAWLAAKPDVIIIAEHNVHIIGSPEAFAARSEVVSSPAAKNHHIYLWPANDFLRYGLDTPEILQKLHQLAK